MAEAEIVDIDNPDDGKDKRPYTLNQRRPVPEGVVEVDPLPETN